MSQGGACSEGSAMAPWASTLFGLLPLHRGTPCAPRHAAYGIRNGVWRPDQAPVPWKRLWLRAPGASGGVRRCHVAANWLYVCSCMQASAPLYTLDRCGCRRAATAAAKGEGSSGRGFDGSK